MLSTSQSKIALDIKSNLMYYDKHFELLHKPLQLGTIPSLSAQKNP